MIKSEKKNLAVKVYSQAGKEVNEIQLAENVFGIKPTVSLVHQVYVTERANQREPWADTKGKGEVRGGGKKPWKQKGTGRARHGSIRSPIWKGGGITFGPLSVRNYKQKINKKMSKIATAMCFSDRVNDGKLIVVENLENLSKTKDMATLLKSLPCANGKTLILVERMEENLKRALKNLPRVELKKAVDASVMDVLHNQYILVTSNGLKNLEKRLA